MSRARGLSPRGRRNVARVALIATSTPTMTTLSDLQATAIELYRARVTIICEDARCRLSLPIMFNCLLPKPVPRARRMPRCRT